MVRTAEQESRPVPEENQDADGRDRTDGGRKRPSQSRQSKACPQVFAIGALEARPLALLESEAAHDAHARQIALQYVAHATKRALVVAHTVVKPA